MFLMCFTRSSLILYIFFYLCLTHVALKYMLQHDIFRCFICYQYGNTKDNYHFFKWGSLEGIGDSKTYQEPQEVVEKRMYAMDEDDKNILTKIELM